MLSVCCENVVAGCSRFVGDASWGVCVSLWVPPLLYTCAVSLFIFYAFRFVFFFAILPEKTSAAMVDSILFGVAVLAAASWNYTRSC